jgi:RNA recognition motif. (a.k.a. RRM, RBD, or RNP domain)
LHPIYCACLLQELVELASPFGQIVQSKLNVGPNRNQAFIEFTDVSLAIQMVNFFASSSEPAKVGGHDEQATGRVNSKINGQSHHTWQVAAVMLYSSHLQVRGKTVYLQYSTRDQIINSTARTGEASGNVILVSLENLDVRT